MKSVRTSAPLVLGLGILCLAIMLGGCLSFLARSPVVGRTPSPRRPNLVEGKSYTFEGIAPHENYPDAEPPKLTDGVRAPAGHVNRKGSDPYILGFHQPGANGLETSIVFDLGAREVIGTVRVSVYANPDNFVYYPDEVRVLGSDDGLTWTLLGTIPSPVSRPDQVRGSKTIMLDVNDVPAAARYVKLSMTTGVGTSWIMLDEVEVLRPIARKIPQAHERSMWVWKTEDIVLDPDVQDQFFEFLRAPHGNPNAAVTTLFFLPARIFNESSPERDTDYIPKLQEFIARATAEGIVVNYMNGVHEWRFRAYHPNALAVIRRVLDYNEMSPPESRFNGIHLDIEKVKDVRDEYLELVRAIAEEIDRRGADITLAFDLPPWLHDARYDYLDRQVLDVADYIGLMDYWDTADKIIEDAIGPVTYAGSIGKKVVIGVDVTPKSDLGQLHTTFYDEGWAYMEQELARVHEELSQYEGYGGIAIHSYDHYVSLPERR